MELVRAVGGISWVVGAVTLFFVPSFGLMVLGIAVLMTVWSVTKTRARRHEELMGRH